MPDKIEKMNLPLQYRDFAVRQEDINLENRTLNLSFSSEAPVERFFGWEILDHAPSSVDLSRAAAKKMPLLLNHKTDQRLGIVERAVISEDRKGRATVRFSKNALAKETLEDIRDGILSAVSVGYRIREMVLEKSSEKEGDFYRATRWEPLEISFVSVPADIDVGSDRSETGERNEVTIINRSEKIMPDEIKNQNEVKTPVEVKNDPPAPPVVDTAKIERDTRETELRRINEIDAIARQFGMIEDGQKAIREGASVDSFRQKVLDKMHTEKHIDTKAAEIDLPEKDKKRYSFANLLVALTANDPTRAPLEMEISRELEKKMNRKPQGVFVPHEVLFGRTYEELSRTLTAASGAANLVGTDHLAGSFIELLRNRLVVAGLGTMTLTGLTENVSIPKQSAGNSGTWLSAESSSVTAADQTFTAVTLSPKNVGADTYMSRQAILQANPSIEMLVMQDLIAALATSIDLGAISGSGASGQPTGITNTSGVGSVTGTAIGWDAVVEFETDVAAANADLGSMNYLTNASVRGILKTRKKDAGSGLFLMDGNMMNGYNVAVSNQVAANTLIFGAFSQLIMGFWGVLDVVVNPFTSIATRYVGIHATQTADVAVRHAAAFSVSSDVS